MLGERLSSTLSRLTLGRSDTAGGTTLLVEDDLRDIELTIEGLRLGGFGGSVVIARDGPTALDYLSRQARLGEEALPELVLLDIKLPKLDGLELLEIIRADPALASLRVALITSSAEPRDAARAKLHGCEAYIVKPQGLIGYMQSVQRLVQS